jgi:hypothetical protein
MTEEREQMFDEVERLTKQSPVARFAVEWMRSAGIRREKP